MPPSLVSAKPFRPPPLLLPPSLQPRRRRTRRRGSGEERTGGGAKDSLSVLGYPGSQPGACVEGYRWPRRREGGKERGREGGRKSGNGAGCQRAAPTGGVLERFSGGDGGEGGREGGRMGRREEGRKGRRCGGREDAASKRATSRVDKCHLDPSFFLISLPLSLPPSLLQGLPAEFIAVAPPPPESHDAPSIHPIVPSSTAPLAPAPLEGLKEGAWEVGGEVDPHVWQTVDSEPPTMERKVGGPGRGVRKGQRAGRR